MGSLRKAAVAVLSTIAFFGVAAGLSAHEVTYSGTVVAMETARYAQPDGSTLEVQELQVSYVDEKTKKPAQKVFTINAETRLLRGDESVSVADAAIEKGEKVEVVVNHDTPGDIALEVKLQAGQESTSRPRKARRASDTCGFTNRTVMQTQRNSKVIFPLQTGRAT